MVRTTLVFGGKWWKFGRPIHEVTDTTYIVRSSARNTCTCLRLLIIFIRLPSSFIYATFNVLVFCLNLFVVFIRSPESAFRVHPSTLHAHPLACILSSWSSDCLIIVACSTPPDHHRRLLTSCLHMRITIIASCSLNIVYIYCFLNTNLILLIRNEVNSDS